jgi:hypothetical protein
MRWLISSLCLIALAPLSIAEDKKDPAPRSLTEEAAYLTDKSGKSGWISAEVTLTAADGKRTVKAQLTIAFFAAKQKPSGPVMLGWKSDTIGVGRLGGQDFELVEKEGKRSIKVKNRFSGKEFFSLDYSVASDILTLKGGKIYIWVPEYTVDLTKTTTFKPGK